MTFVCLPVAHLPAGPGMECECGVSRLLDFGMNLANCSEYPPGNPGPDAVSVLKLEKKRSRGVKLCFFKMSYRAKSQTLWAEVPQPVAGLVGARANKGADSVLLCLPQAVPVTSDQTGELYFWLPLGGSCTVVSPVLGRDTGLPILQRPQTHSLPKRASFL